MPDNYPHEFDEQFVDQAWAEMRSLLDRELPVAGKRRAAGWWHWALLGLALLFSISGGLYHWYATSDVDYLRSSAAGVAAPQQVPKAGVDQETALPVLPPATERTARNKQRQATLPAGVQESKADLPAGQKPQAKLQRQSLEPAATHPANVGTVGKTEDEQSTLPTKAPFENNIPVENSSSSTIEKAGLTGKEAIPRNKMAELQPLYAELNELEAPAAQEVLPTPQATFPPLFQFAAEAGMFSSGKALTEGAAMGMSATLQFRNSLWQLRAGLFYRFYAQEVKNGEKIHSLQNSAFQVPQQGQFVPRTSYLWASNEITETHNLGFPLLVGLQVQPRLAVEAGLEAGILLAARESASWSVSGENSSPSGPKAERGESIYQSERKAALQSLNTTNLSLLGGVTYQPASHIGLRLFYQHGLTNVLASSDVAAYQRGLWLSMSYSLSR